MSVLRVTVPLAAALVLAACGSAEEGEIQQWMAEQRAQSRPRVQPIPEPKKFSPQSYTQVNAFDPFSNQKLTQALKRRMDVEVRCFGERAPTSDGVTVRGYTPWERLKADKSGQPQFAPALETLSIGLAMARDAVDADVAHAHTWYADMAGLWIRTLHRIPLIVSGGPNRPRLHGCDRLDRGAQFAGDRGRAGALRPRG